MKYPCGIIKDLLPLYIDGVCNDESKRAVEEHLSECEQCRNYFGQMKSENNFCSTKTNGSEDLKMAKSLKNIKSSIVKKRVLASLISAAAVIAAFFGTISVLKNMKCSIEYENNISVTESTPEYLKPVQGEKYLSAQIAGRTALDVTQKRVETQSGHGTEVRIYFYAATTKWEDMVANKKTISYHLLTPLNEDNEIDKIFYYVGDYTDLENMNEVQLSQIDKKSKLLWSK